MILAVLEAQEGHLRKISHEVVAAARRADELLGGGGVTALLLGPKTEEAARQAAGLGVERVLYADSDLLQDYSSQAYAQAVLAAHGKVSGKAIVFGASSYGRDLAPRLSADLGAALFTDVTELFTRDGLFAARRSAYSGKVITEVVSHSEVTLVAVRPNAFDGTQAGSGNAEVERFAPELDGSKVRARAAEVRRQSATRPELTEANVVVAGGRGLKDEENFAIIEGLADALGGAVGATRALVDSGWRPHSEQIGQTGKNVAPALYFAIAISGAVQHVAGMLSSRTIVTINKDAEAPMFAISDYGIVGDAMEVVPRLIEEIEKLNA